MNDMSKWEALFGRRDDHMGGMSPMDDSPIEIPEPPADDHPITFSLVSDGGHVPIVTGLRGTWTETAGFVVPFASPANLIDCLRLLIRQVERDTADRS